MKIKRFFLLIILVIALISVSGCLSFVSKKENINQSSSGSNLQLEKEYQQSLKVILQPFFKENQFSGIREQILELRAPVKYLDLHLNLVLAFDLIQQGQEASDQAKIEEGLEKINQLKDQYPWIK